MLELVLRFKQPVNVLLYLAFLVFNVGWCWLVLRKRARIPLAPVIAFNVLCIAAWGVLSRVNHDDSAFVHFAWMISRGLVPFRDYWEHHSPMLPLLMSPFVRAIPGPLAALDAARFFSAAMLVANGSLGWLLAKRIWGGKALLPVYLLLVTSVSVAGQYLILRPDLLMTFFILAGLYASLDAPARPLSAFCSGAAFGLAASFIPKQYFLLFVPVIVIAAGPKPGRVWKSALYLLGFCAGVLPLAAYIAGQGLTGLFLSWMGFSGKIILATVFFPLVILAAGVCGFFALLKSPRTGDAAAPGLAGLSLFCLSTLSSITTTSESASSYYLGFWYFTCAILACGVDLPSLLDRIRPAGGKALVAGIAFTYLLLPNTMGVWTARHGDYARGKKEIAEFMRYSAGGSVLTTLPHHPLFASDATRVYSAWQFYYTDQYAKVREDARSGGFAKTLMDSGPAVISRTWSKRDFLLELVQRGLLTREDYSLLRRFLARDYGIRRIGEETYYVRKDKLQGQNN